MDTAQCIFIRINIFDRKSKHMGKACTFPERMDLRRPTDNQKYIFNIIETDSHGTGSKYITLLHEIGREVY